MPFLLHHAQDFDSGANSVSLVPHYSTATNDNESKTEVSRQITTNEFQTSVVDAPVSYRDPDSVLVSQVSLMFMICLQLNKTSLKNFLCWVQIFVNRVKANSSICKSFRVGVPNYFTSDHKQIPPSKYTR
jgi:hypothetical protein